MHALSVSLNYLVCISYEKTHSKYYVDAYEM
jgi:hypothetical protein